ncbi:MAG: signal peptidase I [Spirochaetia bacterium]|nr:signal peptidase I [Spirochaetia bacterium]
MRNWLTTVQYTTEKVLTLRKRKKLRQKQKQQAKHPVLDWLEAFIWAAGVVLLINQYLFQAYQIPSGSMIDTLLIKDHIFVNKIIFGPELIPGKIKIPSVFKPERNDVMIFENPTYISRGPTFDILQRVLYMLTLSLVDIDKDENGNPKPHFLIKRAAAVSGDSIRFREGEVQIKPPGFENWLDESLFLEISGLPDRTRRMVNPSDYSPIRASAYIDAYRNVGIEANEKLIITASASPGSSGDMFAWMKYRNEALYSINPHETRYGNLWRKFQTGWYIPPGYLMPLGDNRDNSKDGRYFGPVSLDKVLGKAMFKYWPLDRVGKIE